MILTKICFTDRLFPCKDPVTARNSAIRLGESLGELKKAVKTIARGFGVSTASLPLPNFNLRF